MANFMMNLFKKNSQSPYWIGFMFISILLGDCSKKNGSLVTGISNTSQAILLDTYFKSNPKYTLFYQALQRSQVIDILHSQDSLFTVFAPTDSAMLASGFSDTSINSMPIKELTSLIKYHILPESQALSQITKFSQIPVATLDSNYLCYLENNNYGTFVNGVRVISSDIQMVNGLVEEIKSPLNAPLGDIFTTISKDPNLSLFYYEFEQTQALYLLQVGNLGVVPGGPPSGLPSGFYSSFILYQYFSYYTLGQTCLVPENSAYAKYGVTNTSELRYLDTLNIGLRPGYLTAYPNSQFFTSDFLGTFNYRAYENTSTTSGVFTSLIFSTDGITGYPNSNNTQYSLGGTYVPSSILTHIVKGNIICTNGVIHIIDQLLGN